MENNLIKEANMYGFILDERLKSSCFYLLDWPLSQVLLKNNALFPWLILVPRRQDISEITDLSKDERSQLMEEICHATRVLQDFYKPDKINTGALGNIVKQLHIHIVARFTKDACWPQGIWHANTKEEPYSDAQKLIYALYSKLS